MATATLTLDAWKIEYHRTMTAAGETQRKLKTREFTTEDFVRNVVGWLLRGSFNRVNEDTIGLIRLLDQLESLPSTFLLEDEGSKIPEYLRDLFKAMCEVIQAAERLRLQETWTLRNHIHTMKDLSMKISGFATRYETALFNLKSRVSPEDAKHYKESFEAYAVCGPATDDFTPDDVKGNIFVRPV
jgi:hypothetical protein